MVGVVSAVTLLALACLFQVAAALTNWPSLLDNLDDAIRSERDILDSIPVDQLSGLGVSLNRLVFDSIGYTSALLDIVNSVLNVKSAPLALDLYYNEYTSAWQLCPEPFPINVAGNISLPRNISGSNLTAICELSFAVSDLAVGIANYLQALNVRFEGNLVPIMLSLKRISRQISNSTNSSLVNSFSTTQPQGNSSLSGLFSALNRFRFLPSDLAEYNELSNYPTSVMYNSVFPSQSQFLYSMFKRTFLMVMENEANYTLSQQDNQAIFQVDNNLNALVNHAQNISSVLADCALSKLAYNSTEIRSFVASTPGRIIFDSNELPFSTHSVHLLAQCGWSPILNCSNYRISNSTKIRANYTGEALDQFLAYGLWSWMPGQPEIPLSDFDSDDLDGEDAVSKREFEDEENEPNDLESSVKWNGTFWTAQPYRLLELLSHLVGRDISVWQANFLQKRTNTVQKRLDWISEIPAISPLHTRETNDTDTFGLASAYRCASMTAIGWSLSNCYDKHSLACQNDADPFDWRFLKSKISYFDSIDDSPCPDNYSFSVPLLGVEQLALAASMIHSEINETWIDMNDITVPGCFVSGGPYAACPYRHAVTTSKIITRAAPSIIVAVLVLVLMLFERFFLMKPIHANRNRHWKRVLSSYYKENDFEGVPS